MRRLILSITFLAPLFLLQAQQTDESYTTPSALIGAYASMLEEIEDYQCRMYETCSKGRKTEERVINFYWRRPRFIRMDILRGSRFRDKGSVGVYLNDEMVTGRKGGWIGFLSIRVDKTDSLATTIRGVTFDQSDMLAALERMQDHLLYSECILKQSGGLYELTFLPGDTRRSGGITREEIRLDSRTLLPLQADSYEDGRLVQHIEWSSYILNAGLPPALFDVFWDPAQLEDSGIPSLHSLPVQEE